MNKKIVNRGQRREDRRQQTEKKSGTLFVVSGPSGSGKTTLAKKILKDKTLKNRLKRSISFTTRLRRSNERRNRDYVFISEDRFQEERRGGKILEWIRYLGHYYGTPKYFVDSNLSQGRHILMCIDLKGAMKLKRFYPVNTVTIFVLPPSIRELRERIKKRCNKIKKEEIRQRIVLAKKEILAAHRFDYCLVNKDLDRTVQQLKNIILSRIGNKDTC